MTKRLPKTGDSVKWHEGDVVRDALITVVHTTEVINLVYVLPQDIEYSICSFRVLHSTCVVHKSRIDVRNEYWRFAEEKPNQIPNK